MQNKTKQPSEQPLTDEEKATALFPGNEETACGADRELLAALKQEGQDLPHDLHEKIMGTISAQPIPRKFTFHFPFGTAIAAVLVLCLLYSTGRLPFLSKNQISSDKAESQIQEQSAQGDENGKKEDNATAQYRDGTFGTSPTQQLPKEVRAVTEQYAAAGEALCGVIVIDTTTPDTVIKMISLPYTQEDGYLLFTPDQAQPLAELLTAEELNYTLYPLNGEGRLVLIFS